MPKSKISGKEKKAIYAKIIRRVFDFHFQPNLPRFEFRRGDLREAAEELGFDLAGSEKAVAKNLGDIVYSFRFRRDFPEEIKRKAPAGKMWIITGKGDAQYEFRLITTPALAPDPNWFLTKLHDATPEIVRRFELSDEQAVLARIRYNRLVDVFC